MHIKTWHVDLFVDEEGDRTVARAVLHTEPPLQVVGGGLTGRTPVDGSAR
jgi:hypothetical protein